MPHSPPAVTSVTSPDRAASGDRAASTAAVASGTPIVSAAAAVPAVPAGPDAPGSDALLAHPDYQRIARAIRHLDEHWGERPGLAALAHAAGLSPWHFNRLFRRWAGVTPKQYLQWLALDAAKLALRAPGGSVLAAACAAGCSGPGRLHDLFVSVEAMTPGEYRRGGAGVELRWGTAASPFGTLLAARSERGLCHLAFVDVRSVAGAPATGEAALAAEWPAALRSRDDSVAQALVAILWPGGEAAPARLHLALRGTNFQLQVWRALLDLGARGTTTYGALARAIGVPAASRAVGGAVGDNPVGWIVPCHRVLRGDGALGGYRWDPDRKRTMLAWEYAQRRRAALPGPAGREPGGASDA